MIFNACERLGRPSLCSPMAETPHRHRPQLSTTVHMAGESSTGPMRRSEKVGSSVLSGPGKQRGRPPGASGPFPDTTFRGLTRGRPPGASGPFPDVGLLYPPDAAGDKASWRAEVRVLTENKQQRRLTC